MKKLIYTLAIAIIVSTFATSAWAILPESFFSYGENTVGVAVAPGFQAAYDRKYSDSVSIGGSYATEDGGAHGGNPVNTFDLHMIVDLRGDNAKGQLIPGYKVGALIGYRNKGGAAIDSFQGGTPTYSSYEAGLIVTAFIGEIFSGRTQPEYSSAVSPLILRVLVGYPLMGVELGFHATNNIEVVLSYDGLTPAYFGIKAGF